MTHEYDEALEMAIDAAKERQVELNKELSEAAFRFGCTSMKLVIGKALRDDGWHDAAVIALRQPNPSLDGEAEKYEAALKEVRAVTKGTIQ